MTPVQGFLVTLCVLFLLVLAIAVILFVWHVIESALRGKSLATENREQLITLQKEVDVLKAKVEGLQATVGADGEAIGKLFCTVGGIETSIKRLGSDERN